MKCYEQKFDTRGTTIHTIRNRIRDIRFLWMFLGCNNWEMDRLLQNQHLLLIFQLISNFYCSIQNHWTIFPVLERKPQYYHFSLDHYNTFRQVCVFAVQWHRLSNNNYSLFQWRMDCRMRKINIKRKKNIIRRMRTIIMQFTGNDSIPSKKKSHPVHQYHLQRFSWGCSGVIHLQRWQSVMNLVYSNHLFSIENANFF